MKLDLSFISLLFGLNLYSEMVLPNVAVTKLREISQNDIAITDAIPYLGTSNKHSMLDTS